MERIRKHEGSDVNPLLHKQLLSEEKFQRALAAYNGRRELERNDEESEVYISIVVFFF